MLVLALVGCGPNAEEQQCASFAASTNISDYVNPDTGRLERNGRGDVIDARTGRVSLTRSQVECITREAEKAIGRYQNGG